MYSINSKRRYGGRISVWVLVFTLLLTFITAMIIPASAANIAGGVGDAATDMGNAIGDAAGDMGDGIGRAAEDIGQGVGQAAEDIYDNGNDGVVNDRDGIIGNQRSGADKDMTSGNTAENPSASNDAKKAGWIALAIAIVVIIAVVVLAIVFIPKKKENN